MQVTDARDGAHLWSERFDRDLDDIFAVQDEITLTVATALQVKLTEGEQALLRHTSTKNVEAWTHFIRGLSHFRTVSADTYRQARASFEQALAHDPDSAQINAISRVRWPSRAGFTGLRTGTKRLRGRSHVRTARSHAIPTTRMPGRRSATGTWRTLNLRSRSKPTGAPWNWHPSTLTSARSMLWR